MGWTERTPVSWKIRPVEMLTEGVCVCFLSYRIVSWKGGEIRLL